MLTSPQELPLSSYIEQVRDEIRSLLRSKGMRSTAARLAVLMTLHEKKGPMTHEQIMADLPSGSFDKASIWRILSNLADRGLLRRMDLGDRIWRYELLDACRTVDDDHTHFLCESCGDVLCLPPLEIKARDGALPAALMNADFQVRVMGRCASCTSG